LPVTWPAPPVLRSEEDEGETMRTLIITEDKDRKINLECNEDRTWAVGILEVVQRILVMQSLQSFKEQNPPKESNP
jgi:hypothetical protein